MSIFSDSPIPEGLGAQLSESSGWQSVSSSSSANTNGSIVELIAASSFASVWVTLFIQQIGGTSDPLAKFDILVGPATSEVEKIVDEGIKREWFSGAGIWQGTPMGWPFVIPSGSRISIRIEDNVASALSYSVLFGIFKEN